MKKTIIDITERKGMRFYIGDDERNAASYAEQLKRIFSGTEYGAMYGAPVILSDRIEWYTDLNGEIVNIQKLNEDERKKAITIARKNVKDMLQYVKNMNDEKLYSFVDKTLEIPTENSIYFINGKVTLTNWGFISDGYKAEKGILKKILGPFEISVDIYINEYNGAAAKNKRATVIRSNGVNIIEEINNGKTSTLIFESDEKIEIIISDIENKKLFHNSYQLGIDNEKIEITLPEQNEKYDLEVNAIYDSGEIYKNKTILVSINDKKTTYYSDSNGKLIIENITEKDILKFYLSATTEKITDGEIYIYDSLRSHKMIIKRVREKMVFKVIYEKEYLKKEYLIFENGNKIDKFIPDENNLIYLSDVEIGQVIKVRQDRMFSKKIEYIFEDSKIEYQIYIKEKKKSIAPYIILAVLILSAVGYYIYSKKEGQKNIVPVTNVKTNKDYKILFTTYDIHTQELLPQVKVKIENTENREYLSVSDNVGNIEVIAREKEYIDFLFEKDGYNTEKVRVQREKYQKENNRIKVFLTKKKLPKQVSIKMEWLYGNVKDIDLHFYGQYQNKKYHIYHGNLIFNNIAKLELDSKNYANVPENISIDYNSIEEEINGEIVVYNYSGENIILNTENTGIKVTVTYGEQIRVFEANSNDYSKTWHVLKFDNGKIINTDKYDNEAQEN